MKIYGAVISPFVRMTLVTAHEAGLKDRVSLVQTSAKLTEANPDLLKFSPIAKMPVLETDHHRALHDSRVIMEYLVHVSGRDDLLPDDGVKRFRVLTLLATAQGTADASVALRYELAQRPEAMRWPEYMARLTDRMNAALDDLEHNWADGLSILSLGSIAAACAIGYIDVRHPTVDWRKGRPKLVDFHERFAARDSMKAWPLA